MKWRLVDYDELVAGLAKAAGLPVEAVRKLDPDGLAALMRAVVAPREASTGVNS